MSEPPSPSDQAPSGTPPPTPGGSGGGGVLGYWRRRSRLGKVLISVGAVFVLLIVVGLLAPAEEGNDQTAPAATTAEEVPAATTAEEAPTTAEAPPATTAVAVAPATPKERVQEALGEQVEAGGYAGTLEIRQVTFEGVEAQVFVTTPEGGLQGASCGDLDDGAQAVFETIYNDGGWK
jgi:hypothetical protein